MMKPKLLLFILVFGSVEPGAILSAQELGSPTSVVRDFFEAYYGGLWEEAAGFFHPEFLAEFQDLYVSELSLPVRDGRSGMSDVGLAEVLAAQWPIRDSALARSMDATELLGRILEANDFRIGARDVFDSMVEDSTRGVDTSQRAFEEAINERPLFVGEVTEGDISWVLYRAPHEPPFSSPWRREPPSIMLLWRRGDEWKIADHGVARRHVFSRGYFLPVRPSLRSRRPDA